jgi:hypothetical protein
MKKKNLMYKGNSFPLKPPQYNKIRKSNIWHLDLDTNSRKRLCRYKCEKNGRKIDRKGVPHFFIIINFKEGDSGAVAISVSSKGNLREKYNGISICQDDVNNTPNNETDLELIKGTYALIRKICMIPKEVILEGTFKGNLKRDRFNKIIEEMKYVTLTPI